MSKSDITACCVPTGGQVFLNGYLILTYRIAILNGNKQEREHPRSRKENWVRNCLGCGKRKTTWNAVGLPVPPAKKIVANASERWEKQVYNYYNLIKIKHTHNMAIQHTYKELVNELQPLIGTEIWSISSKHQRYELEDASDKRILLVHYDDAKGTQKKEYLTTTMKGIVEYINEHQYVTKKDIQAAFYKICTKIEPILGVDEEGNRLPPEKDKSSNDDAWNDIRNELLKFEAKMFQATITEMNNLKQNNEQ